MIASHIVARRTWLRGVALAYVAGGDPALQARAASWIVFLDRLEAV